MGSITKVIGEDGKTSAHYNYDEFGRPLSFRKFDQNWPGPDNTFGYTGYQYNVYAGLWYAQARYYDPQVGRFISEDSYKGDIIEPLNLNLYTYVNNNPVNFVDPSGHISIDILDEVTLGEGIWSLKSDTAGRTMLFWYLYMRGTDFVTMNGYYGNYMKKNSILQEKVKELILPYGDKLDNNESIDIDIVTSMEIENGEDIIGYQYLHGTNANAGGFTIKGTISKCDGDITYDLTYTWNDIMDPNFIYDSDSKKAEFAKSIPGADPTGYKLSISWTDKTVIRENPRLFNRNSGWLSK